MWTLYYSNWNSSVWCFIRLLIVYNTKLLRFQRKWPHLTSLYSFNWFIHIHIYICVYLYLRGHGSCLLIKLFDPPPIRVRNDLTTVNNEIDRSYRGDEKSFDGYGRMGVLIVPSECYSIIPSSKTCTKQPNGHQSSVLDLVIGR